MVTSSHNTAPQAILDFWFDLEPRRWFAVDPALDLMIVTRFAPLWYEAKAAGEAVAGVHPDGSLGWTRTPSSALALIILLDQFPRNMFRGKADAFATDALARAVSLRALDRGYDLALPAAQRAFFYLPLMHSEDLADQDRCVALIANRLGTNSLNYPFALEHRLEIQRFGRFPARNTALGRKTTAEEAVYLA